MKDFKSFQKKVKNLTNQDFVPLAIELFHFQAINNPVYAKYLGFLDIDHQEIHSIGEIPFLPISFFKHHVIKTGKWDEKVIFESSGTTSNNKSKHHIRDINFYHQHAKSLFQSEFGNLSGYLILALLPSYSYGSSLVSMVSHFITHSKKGSGFYLDNYEELKKVIERNQDQKIILWGVTFALLEFAKYGTDLNKSVLIETGGMKGRGNDLVREDLYNQLRKAFNLESIYSEYGMTELLSQSYAVNGSFKNSNSMRIIIREVNDPFEFAPPGKTGGVSIIDLANVHSCAFIETQDLGRITSENTFEIVGRFDNSDVRGCNLLLIV